MRILERIIKYQNEAEENFEQSKNVKTTLNYIFAFVFFMLSTLIASFTFPIRFAYKKLFLRNKSSEIIHLDKGNIDSVLVKEELILIDFWAEWCGPCVMMNPTMEKFAAESKNVRVAKVNADLNRGLMNRFKIRGLPQFVLVKNGEEIKRYAGAMTFFELNKFCTEGE